MIKTTAFNFNPETMTRQQRFRAWKAVAGMSYTAMGEKLGVSHVSARTWCLADSAPAARVDQLRRLGVPEDLLPAPRA